MKYLKNNAYRLSRSFIFYISVTMLSVFSIYLLIMGSFVWFNGGCTAFSEMRMVWRGFCMLAIVLLLLFLFRFLSAWLIKQSEQRLRRIAVITGVVLFLLQVGFVLLARAGIRYDSLKVVDEAVALFSQKGISETDLDGYFARYSNNYAITIMTHWLIKIFRAVGLIRRDFSNAVIVLQLINVFFVDAAFGGCYAFLNKYFGKAKAVCFLFYMVCNPLSYVWLPFYYTNTCSMPFAVWGIYLLFAAFDFADSRDKENPKENQRKLMLSVICIFLSGVLFYVGYKIRATVIIALIAGLFGQFYRRSGSARRMIVTCGLILELIFSIGLTKAVYGPIENHYLSFDPSDTAFPATHWVAMGLSYYGDGSYSAEDEQKMVGYPTAEEKKSAASDLIQQRMKELGFGGVCRLYMKKLSNTFGDGAGGYHSELNISRDYGILWQIIYGVHRDPVLVWTQCFYLLSVLCTVLSAVVLWKKKVPEEFFALLLLLLGSYLFQMLWESATIYSIGTMYLTGCMAAVGSPCFSLPQTEKKNLFKFSSLLLGVIGLAGMVTALIRTEYTEVSVSVDQFLFQAAEYPALSYGQEIRQTFRSDKDFSVISFEVRNFTGEYNDSVYLVSLYDGEGNLLQQQELVGSTTRDYGFCPLSFSNVKNVVDYEIRIEKKSGTEDLIFLYYDTGHYDTYPEGKMTGPIGGELADLLFLVYEREEE